MNDFKLLFNIFTKTNNRFITIILLFLIFVLVLTFFSFIFSKSVIVSYKDFVFKNYIGTFGTIHYKVKKGLTKKYLNSLKGFDYIVYYKVKKDIKLTNTPQKLKLIIWKKGNFVNQTLYKLYSNQFKIKNQKIKFKVIDTGFLNQEMTIFLNEKTAKTLNFKFDFNYISINTPIDKVFITKTIQQLKKINDKYMVEYDIIHDILSDNKELLDELDKIIKLQKIIFFSIFVLSFFVIVGGLFIFLNLKRKSIFIIRVYGVLSDTIALFFSIASGIILFFSLFLAYFIFILIKHSYTDLILQNVSLNSYIYVIVLIMILNYIIFKFSLREIKK